MNNLVWIIIIAGGLAIITWIYLWSRQRQEIGPIAEVESGRMDLDVPLAASNDAILVSTEHGQLLHVNELAQRWLGMNGGNPNLEYVASIARPVDSFLALLSTEGQSSFQLGKRWVEASSHIVPVGTDRRMVIRMRELTVQNMQSGSLDLNKSIAIINEIGETVNASMGIEQVLQALLTIIMKSVHSSAGEICLWDEREQALFQHGWVGDTPYVLALAELGGLYRMGEGIVGWVAQNRKPVIVNDTSAPTALQPKVLNHPFKSVISIPLMVEDRLLGTCELYHEFADIFTQSDLALLQAISTPMTVAVYNAELYAKQVQRVNDMASIQQISEAADIEDVAPVYRDLNARIAQLIGTEMCGVLLYDDDRKSLLAEPPFHGLPDHVSRNISIALPPDSPQYNIWTKQPYWVSNDIEDEPLAEAIGLKPIIDLAGIRNTALIPLQIGGERRGILIVSNKHGEGGFTPTDIQNLRVLSAQASIVVENIRLYQREQRIDTELVGLQEITHAIGALSHEGEFYLEITERIANLMGIAMCGILLYDEERKRLVSRLPFFGIDDEIVANYHIDLDPGSVIAELWEDEEYWFSNRVQSDTLVFAAGLDELATKAGVQKTLMAVLAAGGRRLGVIQVSNRLDEADFTPNDARVLLIFATQAAAIIENARLYLEVQRSAEQAQSLRRVAEIAGSVLTTEETFTPVLAEIAKLTESELVFINTINNETRTLITYPRWVYGIELSDPIIQDTRSPGFEFSVVVSHRPFLSNDVPNDKRILPGYRVIADQFHIRDTVIAPLVIGERSLGELGIANRTSGSYDEADLEILSTVSAQIATAIDRLLLYEATGENLSRRMEELDAISTVSNELALTLDLNQVLDVIRQEAARTTKATGSTVAMLVPFDEWKRPDRPEMARRIGEEVQTFKLADIELEAISRGADSVLVNDYEQSRMHPIAQEQSALAAAILYVDQVVGVLHLYHEQPGHFDEQAAAFLVTLATKAALGYGNAMRYQELMDRSSGLRRRVEQLNQIFELGHLLQTSVDPVTIMEAIAYSVQQSVGFDTVLMLLVNKEINLLQRVAHAGMPIEQFERTARRVFPVNKIGEFFKSEFLISETYFFPMEKFQEWHVPDVAALSASFEGNRTLQGGDPKTWRDGDMLLVPLRSAGGDLLGLMSLDRPYNNLRPDRSVIEVLEIFAHQAATTIENTRLYLSSIRNAEQEARLNEIMEAIAKTLDLKAIVEALAHGALQLVPFMRMTVALLDSQQQGFDLIRVIVKEDNTLDITQDYRSDLNNTALGHTYETGEDYLYSAEDREYKTFEDLNILRQGGEHTSLLLPLITGGKNLGAIHIGTDLIQAFGFEEFRTLLKRMAQLVASAVQNAWLFDQAVNLQALNESVVMSIQQGIVVLDQAGAIISINAFMRQRYGWNDEAIRKDLFAYRPYLEAILKKALQTVMETGEPQEMMNQQIIELDGRTLISNFYIYPLRFEDTVRGAVVLAEDSTERSQLEQAIAARANQLAALTEASSRITSSLERDEVIDLALQEMQDIIHYDALTLWRRNGSYMVLEGTAGLDDESLVPRETRVLFSQFEHTNQVVETQHTISISQEEGLSEGFPGDKGAKSWLGVPIINQRHVVGMMVLMKYEAGFYDTDSEQNIAFTFASQVAIALANADLFEQTFDRTNELGTLLEAAQATSQTRDLDELFRTVVELMFSALDMDDCMIMLWDEVDNELVVQVDMNRYGDANRIAPTGTHYNLSDYPAKLQGLNSREVIVIQADDPNDPYPIESQELRQNGDVTRMLVPLVVSDQSIGLIQLEQSHGEQVITQQKVRLARALGAQVAIAIDNARLSNEMTAQFEELILINELSRSISGTLELDHMFKIVRDQVPAITKASELYLALYDSKTEQITFPLAVKQGEPFVIPPRQLNDDEVSFVIRRRQPLSLGADYYDLNEMRRNLGISNSEGDIQSYLGVPLVTGDQILGVLAVRDMHRKRAFTVNENRVLTTVGAQLGAAIQNARLFDQVSNFAEDLNRLVEERTQELEIERDNIDTLYQITSELAQTLDMDMLLRRALGMVAKAVNADDGAIMRIDTLTDNLYSQASLNPNTLIPAAGDDELAHHPAEDLATWLIENEEYDYVIDDLHTTDFWNTDDPNAAQWHSALAVLLETNEDIQGVMVLLSRDVGHFSEDQLRLLVAAANQVASAINNADLYQLIRDQAERLGTLLRAEQEEAEKNRAILEGIADGVVLADAEGTVILFNTASERILQIPRDQVLGQKLAKITGLHGYAASAWISAIQEWSDRDWKTNPKSEQGEFLNERMELDNGKVVSVHLSPVHIGESFLGTVSVFRDISKDVEVDRIKSEFIANVSHEFRTPLTPIKGYTDLLLAGAVGQVNDGQIDVLDKIKQNIDRLTLLVEDVLDISKIDSGHEELHLKSISLPNMVDDIIKKVQPRHKEKNISLDVVIEPTVPPITADPDKMVEIIRNILDNAFNYTPADGSIELKVARQSDTEHILISVKDTGVGIPDSFREAIWRRFERVEEHALTMDVAGTGLGLPIVKELVKMHHGDVWFESELGKGTTFFVTLPIQQPNFRSTTESEIVRIETEVAEE